MNASGKAERSPAQGPCSLSNSDLGTRNSLAVGLGLGQRVADQVRRATTSLMVSGRRLGWSSMQSSTSLDREMGTRD